MTRYVARNLRPKQLIWNQATQDRINRIVSVVSKMKIIKMLGLASVVETQISSLRQAEINASKDMRWVSVLANASGMLSQRCVRYSEMKSSNKEIANALGLFTPAVTIVLFAALGNEKLDAETAYTTLAVLIMVTHPANMIMTILPRAIGSLVSFQRIQDFVSKPHSRDTRLRLEHTASAVSLNANCQTAVEFKDVELRLAGSKERTRPGNHWRNHTFQGIHLDYQ
jgi:ATP-binding cassette subfamily C (CFTR/MRP) protein 1